MLITLFHWLVILYPYFHIFFIKGYDIVLFSYVSIMILSWALLKGECWITVLYKKIENPDYKLGSDAFNINDLGIPEEHYNTVINVVRVSSVIVFLGILMRNYKLLNVPLWCLVYIFMIVYLYLLAYNDLNSAVIFQYILGALTILTFYIYYINYTRHSIKT